MREQHLHELNQRFGLRGQLAFDAIAGVLPAARIANDYATATIALHGGHVMAFQPRGERPVLWMSERSRFEAGAPIRGGIPICWPWFGAHPSDPSQPAHGFARISAWEVARTTAPADGSTVIEMALTDTPVTRAMWPHAFALTLRITVAHKLRVELVARNTSDGAITCAAALHSYFTVSEASAIRVLGLEGCRYIDTVPSPHTQGTQEGSITIRAETDRLYVDTDADSVIEDPGFDRRVRIAKEGSRSTVVWNPWVAKSQRMPDFGDGEYHGMLCIETANVAADARVLPPGGEHRLAAVIGTERLGGGKGFPGVKGPLRPVSANRG